MLKLSHSHIHSYILYPLHHETGRARNRPEHWTPDRRHRKHAAVASRLRRLHQKHPPELRDEHGAAGNRPRYRDHGVGHHLADEPELSVVREQVQPPGRLVGRRQRGGNVR